MLLPSLVDMYQLCVAEADLRVGGVKQPAAYLFYEESKLVFDTINDAKALVMYMKKTLLNKKLNNKMKQDVVMRFDSLLIMLQCMAAELATSIELLKKRKQEECAKCIIEPLFIELIQLLHYFKLASKSLEPFLTPTIHLVGMWFAKLTTHLQSRIEPITIDGADGEKVTIVVDSDEIGAIKVLLFVSSRRNTSLSRSMLPPPTWIRCKRSACSIAASLKS
jgi:hypothetical protein